MKTIKLILFGVLTLFIVSCFEDTCTSFYFGDIKIDGKKDETVSIKYIGPKKRRYEKEFNFKNENKIPYYINFTANTVCSTKDFKKNNYNFLEITNTSSADIYICSALRGAEIPSEKDLLYKIEKLFQIYDKQDKDPNYDYKKDPLYKDIEYLSREDLYKKLFEEKYPYIIKLAPNKTCIIKWGGFGIQVLK